MARAVRPARPDQTDPGRAKPRATGPPHAARALLATAAIYRLLLFGSLGLFAFIALQLLRALAESSGLCTGCNVGTEGGDVLVATAVGGGAAASSNDDDLFGKDYFDRLLNRVFGGEEPDRGLEGMGHPAPHDSSRDAPADVEWIRENLSKSEPSDQPGIAGGSGADNELPTREPGPQSRLSAGPPRRPGE